MVRHLVLPTDPARLLLHTTPLPRHHPHLLTLVVAVESDWLDHKDSQANRVVMVKTAQPDAQVKMEEIWMADHLMDLNSRLTALQDHQEHLETQDLKEMLEDLEWMESPEETDGAEDPESKENVVQMEKTGNLEDVEKMECLEKSEMFQHQQGHRVNVERRDHRAHKGHVEMMAAQEIRVNPDQPVIKDSMEPQEDLGPMESQEHKEQWVLPVDVLTAHHQELRQDIR